MSEQEWSKGAVFDPALVRQDVHEALKVERPHDIETPRAISPPNPDPNLLALVVNPQLAEFWRQMNVDNAARRAAPASSAPADPPPDDAATIAQLGMALYLLQSLHAPDKPGYEHLVRDDRGQKGEEYDDPDANSR